MDFLKVENLYKVYGKDENQVVALNGVSLTIEKGGFTAIIGSTPTFSAHWQNSSMPNSLVSIVDHA